MARAWVFWRRCNVREKGFKLFATACGKKFERDIFPTVYEKSDSKEDEGRWLN